MLERGKDESEKKIRRSTKRERKSCEMQRSGRPQKVEKEERDLSLEDRQTEIEGGTDRARRPK